MNQDAPNGPAVILHMDPIPDRTSLAIDSWTDSGQDVGDLPRNEFFNVLVGTVVVGAIGDGHAGPIGAPPGTR